MMFWIEVGKKVIQLSLRCFHYSAKFVEANESDDVHTIVHTFLFLCEMKEYRI